MTATARLLAQRPEVQLEVGLDREQLHAFQEQGHLAIGRITSSDEVEWLRACAGGAAVALRRSGRIPCAKS